MKPEQMRDLKRMLTAGQKDEAINLFRYIHTSPPPKTYDRPVASFADLTPEEQAEVMKTWDKPRVPCVCDYKGEEVATYFVELLNQLVKEK